MTLISNKTLCYRNPYAPIPGDVYAQGPDSPQRSGPRPEVADNDSPPSEDPASYRYSQSVVSDTADVDVFPAVSAPDILQDLIIDLLLVNNVFDE